MSTEFQELTPALKQARMQEHWPLVRKIALGLCRRMPKSVELDDLVSEGMFGLSDAIDRFDPQRGVQFRTFASRRIKGAILDGIRETDTRPRLMRKRASRYMLARQRLTQTLGRTPAPEEICQQMGLSRLEFGRVYRAVLSSRKDGSLSGIMDATENGADAKLKRRTIDFLPDASQQSRQRLAESNDSLKEMLRPLSRRHRMVLTLYYLEQMTMAEIGRVIGISESRVSQLCGQAIAILRAKTPRDKKDLIHAE
jgi:RNA polymerase sigma factor FliA